MGKTNKSTQTTKKTEKPPMTNKKKFKESWRTHPKLKEWLEYRNGEPNAFCKLCHSEIGCKLSNLLKHAESIMHQKACNSIKGRTVDYQTGLSYSRCSGRKISFNLIQDLALSKCLKVILMANKKGYYQSEELAALNKVNKQVIEEILQWKQHIQKILKYVPNAIKFINPKELNEIIAINEILMEFMWRLMRLNLQITDEELMLNAKLLTKVFGVTAIQIDDNWTFFFRKSFLQCICIDNPTFGKYHHTSFYVRNILNHVQHMLDPEVVSRFNDNLQNNSDDLILICKDMFGKQNKARKETHQLKENQETITDTIEEGEEMKEEPQELCIKEEIEIGEYTINMNTINANDMLNEPHERNRAEEYITNDEDSIELYEVIDEGDDEDLMKVVEKTETTTDDTQKTIDEECIIKQEDENQDYKATEFLPEFFNYSQELLVDQIKADPTEINSDEFFNYSQELLVDQIKADPTEINSDENIEKDVFVKPEFEIKQQPCETNTSSGRNENYKDREICVNSYTIESPISYVYEESLKTEIKQEPNETNASSIYQEISEEPQVAMQVPMEILNAKVNDGVQNKEHEIKGKPNEVDINDDSMHTEVFTKFKCGDHLKEQRALEIGRIFNSKPYRKLYCEILWLDPIICTYMNLLSIKSPLFNEVALRMSFEIVLGEELYDCQYQYSVQSDDLELYRHLITLAYLTNYKWFQIRDIVNETDLKIIVNNSFQILEKWRNFFNKHFISMLYRKAVYEMLFEFNTRYLSISTVLDTKDIQLKHVNLKVLLPSKVAKLSKTTIKNIQTFLRSDFELELENWHRGYIRYIRKKISKDSYAKCRLYKINNLSLNQIYEDIKELLPQLVVENLCCAREKDNMQLVKSNDSESSKAKNPLKDKINALKKQQTDLFMIKKGQNDKMYSKRFSSRDLSIKKSENIIKSPIEEQAHTLETVQLSNDYSSEEPPKKKQKVEDLMHIVDNNSNFKDMDNINGEASESTTEIDLLVKKINMYANDANTVETTEIANIKKFEKWQTSHMFVLRNDPIITSYLKLFKILEYGTDLPVYSETILRKAFDATFADNNIGQYSECQQQDLQLYSKLLLLYYFDNVKYTTSIADIMICFDEISMKEHLENIPNIIIEWRTFFKKNLSRLLYKQAIYVMLYEYTQRYLRIQKEISDETLILIAAEIQRFLHCYIILPDQWLEHFKSLYKIRLGPNNYITNLDLFSSLRTNHTKNTSIPDRKGHYLDFLTIYASVKHRLNFLITDTIEKVIVSLNSIFSDGKFVENLNIKELGQDPIIKKYFQLSNEKKTANSSLPVFNESLLISSFNEVFKNYRKLASIKCQFFQLYCQLILFKYSEQYSLAELYKIMTCFRVSSILRYFKSHFFILRKWSKFNMDILSAHIFQQALYEMLYEYARRFMRMYGSVTDNHLKRKSEEIKDFFGHCFYLPNNWLSDFYRMILKRLAITKEDIDTKLSHKDLELENIYESIKSRFHFSVIQKRDLIVTSCKRKQSIEYEKEVMENIRPITQDVRKNETIKIVQDSCEYTKVHNDGTQESSVIEINDNKIMRYVNGFIVVEEIDHDKEETLYELSIVDSSLTKELEIECKQVLKRDMKCKLGSKNSQQDTRIQSEKLRHKLKQQHISEQSDDFMVKHEESEATTTIEATKLNENKIVFNGLRNKIKASTSKQCNKINKSEEIICRIMDYKSSDEEEIEIIVMSDSDIV